ncbi:hypothetical protein DRV84_11655 [Rhodosalinus sediminis]|uniref:DUF3618 domain-containing protein n=1 Tax=Rhodosalinus sediminis TaxID=1940533 RepID=A0A3D9BQ49_9RHOB|nr:hypothetical protein [Rhodosalinus sediminis]REC55481.1 hypothetical protein DRV84_11655 [Rhodosalinus sediminis]
MTRPDLTEEARTTARDIAGEVHRLSAAAERTAREARAQAAEDIREAAHLARRHPALTLAGAAAAGFAVARIARAGGPRDATDRRS